MNTGLEKITCKECKHKSKCFKHLLREELEFLDHHKVQLVYSKGEIICKQGSFASSLIYILDGLIKLLIEGPGNKNLIIRIIKPSEFVGLSSLFDENIYHYSAVTLKTSSVCMIEKEIINKLIRENGLLATEIIKWHCQVQTQHYKKFEGLMYKQLPGRLADTLLYLNREDFGPDNVYPYLTRKDLAELSGMSTESAVRILSEFDHEGIIQTSGRNIKITDTEKLEKISKTG